MSKSLLRIALVGNPNAGKSTLFNALSGLRQQIANYPGVTVEMKKGRFHHDGQAWEIIDLPGTYSLAARSPDEMVAVDLLLGRRPEESPPDLILAVVDATNLDRHLYLTTQVMELGLPVVVAVTMNDTAQARGIQLNPDLLAKSLQLPVVAVDIPRGRGIEELLSTLSRAQTQTPTQGPTFPPLLDELCRSLQEHFTQPIAPFLLRRCIWDENGQTERLLCSQANSGFQEALAAVRSKLKAEHGLALEAQTRYRWIREATKQAVVVPQEKVRTASDRLDRILTHRIWGTLIFLLIMFVMFQSIFVWATPLMNLIDSGFESLGSFIETMIPAGPLRSLLTDGVITGVGSVLVFLPQILILFGFIAILEDCGYMARAAYLMDRLMRRCGLNGKSFIPLLSSTACAVPGILATRVIEQKRDRLATILVAPLMSCSARLPVYALFIGAFFREDYAWWVPGLMLFGMYMIGFIVAPLVALILKRTLLRGENPTFLMELPNFKRPTLRAVMLRMFDAGKEFIVRAGTMILASMILIWALLYFPYVNREGLNYVAEIETITEDLEALSNENPQDLEKIEALTELRDRLLGEWKRNSYLGRCGQVLEPAFEPLGWDWKIGMAALASFPAREVMVGTFGLLYDRGDVDPGAIDDPEDESAVAFKTTIRNAWQSDPVRGKYAPVTATSVMIFFALCCQCVSTLAVIRRETRSWSWPIFTFVYMTVLAYLGALLVYQLGTVIVDQLS